MKRFITSILIFAMLLTCTSCQSTGTSKNSAELSIYLLDNDFSTKQSVAKFNSDRQKGRINIKTYLSDEIQDYKDTLLSELAHGNGPDIIVLYAGYIYNLAQYLSLDAFYDINELIRKDKAFKLEDYDNRILDCGVKDGKRYLIPLSFTVDALFSTEEVLKSHNLSTDKRILSLEDLHALSKSFASQNGTAWIDSLPYMGYISYFVDPMKQTAFFDTEEFKNFMDHYQALSQSASVAAKDSWGTSMLSQGKVALFKMPISGPQSVVLPYQSFDKAVTDPILLGYTLSEQEGPIPATPSVLVGINKNCANIEAAYEFIKLLLSTEEQKARGQIEAIPINLEAYDKVKTDSLRFYAQQFGSSMDEATFIGLLEQMDQIVKGELICRIQDNNIGNMIHEELMNYQTGSKTREAACMDMQNGVLSYFRQDPSLNAPSPSPEGNTSQVEKLSLHYLDYDNYIKNAIRIFNERQKDVQIDGISYPHTALDHYRTQLTTSVMAGEGPDILIYRTFFFNSISKTMATGAFADLNPLIEKDPSFDTSAYYPEIFDAGVFNGKRYYIPLFFTIPNLIASKSSLAALGITADDSGWTLGDLKNAIAQFKASNPSSGQYFFDSSMDFLSLVRSSGLQLVDYQNKATHFQSKDFIDLMVLYKEISPLIIPREIEMNLDLSPVLLKDNKVRMISLGSLSPKKLAMDHSVLTSLLKDDFTILSFPTAEVGAKSPARLSDVVSVNAQCRNQQAAFDFVKLLLSEDIQRTFDSHGLPNNTPGQPINKNAYIKDMEAEKSLSDNEEGYIISNGSRTMTVKAVPLTDTVVDRAIGITNHMAAPAYLDQEVENIINEGVQAFLSGKQTAEEAAKEIDEKVTLYLNE